MKKSIEYGSCSPKSDFDRRPSTPHSVSYVAGSMRGSAGKPTYAMGNRSKNSKGKANSVKQMKSQGMTGKTHGSGGNKFGSPKGSVKSLGGNPSGRKGK